MTIPRLISTYISRIALCSSISLLPCAALAQAVRQTTSVKKPQVEKKINAAKKSIFSNDTTRFFRHIAVSVDIAGPIQMAVSDYGQMEVQARVDLKDKYFPVVELGYGKADADNPASHIHYTSKAPYFRVGCDYNMLRNKHDRYRVYLGGRYGYSNFKFDIEHPGIVDPVWHTPVPYGAKGEKSQYHWLEGVAGVDAGIWGPLRLGWSIRYKRRISQSKGDIGSPWYVPGFGKSGGTAFGATFNITMEL